MSREFPLAVVLSAYHNKLMVPFWEFREFLDYITGSEVALWEIPRARAMAASHLAKQYPWLKKTTPPPGFKVDAGQSGRFIRKIANEVGTFTLEVRPLPSKTFIPHGIEQGPWARRKKA